VMDGWCAVNGFDWPDLSFAGRCWSPGCMAEAVCLSADGRRAHSCKASSLALWGPGMRSSDMIVDYCLRAPKQDRTPYPGIQSKPGSAKPVTTEIPSVCLACQVECSMDDPFNVVKEYRVSIVRC
jgi:hypothetical protein